MKKIIVSDFDNTLKYISKKNVKYLDEFGNDAFKDDNINLVVFDILI